MTLPAYPIRPDVLAFEPYAPGLAIDEIRARFGLESVVKMASNENPLGCSPVVQKTLKDNAGLAFRYAQSGNRSWCPPWPRTTALPRPTSCPATARTR